MFAIYREQDRIVKIYSHNGRWEIVDTGGLFEWVEFKYPDKMSSLEIALREFVGSGFDKQRLEILENKG